MITEKIKSLFQFIEYLHSNIENFNLYNDLINELQLLNTDRDKLTPIKNYKDKLQYDQLQAEIKSKFETLQDNTANHIKAKAKELKVCGFNDVPHYGFNGIETEIQQLKENFSDDDILEIFRRKSQYIEYRTHTHSTFLSLEIFFDSLDKITKSLFDFFKETSQNEFEEFEKKSIRVNSLEEAVNLLHKGHKSFTLPSSILNNKKQQLSPEQHHSTLTKSRLDFTKDKLQGIILEIAKLNGYEKPSTYLNELLSDVKQFNDIEFECNFFLNIHYLCRDNADKFWSESHRKDISRWLNKGLEVMETDVFLKTWDALPPQQTEWKAEQETIEMKPVLKPEAVQIVFEIIKDFFSTEQQADLKQVIETGSIASKKLLFKGNGNRLTDTFKKLIEHDFITGCQKQDLINWIISNFTFTQKDKVKTFIYDTVEKTISRNDNPCKSPMIEIKNGQIQKVEQPRTKKYNKY